MSQKRSQPVNHWPLSVIINLSAKTKQTVTDSISTFPLLIPLVCLSFCFHLSLPLLFSPSFDFYILLSTPLSLSPLSLYPPSLFLYVIISALNPSPSTPLCTQVCSQSHVLCLSTLCHHPPTPHPPATHASLTPTQTGDLRG